MVLKVLPISYCKLLLIGVTVTPPQYFIYLFKFWVSNITVVLKGLPILYRKLLLIVDKLYPRYPGIPLGGHTPPIHIENSVPMSIFGGYQKPAVFWPCLKINCSKMNTFTWKHEKTENTNFIFLTFFSYSILRGFNCQTPNFLIPVKSLCKTHFPLMFPLMFPLPVSNSQLPSQLPSSVYNYIFICRGQPLY